LPINLKPVENSEELQGEDIPLSENQNRYFSELVNNYLTTASDDLKVKGSEMLLTFSSEITSQLSQGVTNLVPFVSKSIVANPYALAALAGIVVVTAASQYLITINSKIDEIDQGISEIKQYLNQERWSKILGNYQHLLTFSNNLKENSYNFNTENYINHIINEIGAIERECLQVCEATFMQLNNILKEIPDEKDLASGSLNIFKFDMLDENKIKIKEIIKRYAQMQSSYLLAIQVANLGTQINSSLPVRKDLLKARIAVYRKHLSNCRNHILNFKISTENSLSQLKANKIKSIIPLVSRDNTEQNKEEIMMFLKEVISEFDTNASKLDKYILEIENLLQQQINDSNKPLSFAVIINKAGRLISLKKIFNIENNLI